MVPPQGMIPGAGTVVHEITLRREGIMIRFDVRRIEI
jgi:hypothetical protein